MEKDCNNLQAHSVKLDVLNDLGLHARVAARIAATVQQYDCELMLQKDHIQVEGDSILSILTLDAPKGTSILARARGPQSMEALDALKILFDSGFGD